MEGSYFLGQDSGVYSASSSGDPLLARPFVNALTNSQNSELVARAGDPANPFLIPLTGTVAATMTSQLSGAELNALFNVCNNCFCGGRVRFDVLGGFRYLSLAESLTIQENLQVPSSSLLIPGTTFQVTDRFSTNNSFYGAQIGGRRTLDYHRWELLTTGKLAIGVTRQEVNIQGSSFISDPNNPPPVSANVGLLASSSNSGTYSRDVFTVVPEFNVSLGYRLTDNLKVFVGYTFLFWSDVARPGDQIDTSVNPNQLPQSGMTGGPSLPAFFFHGTSFFAQGVNFGVEFRF